MPLSSDVRHAARRLRQAPSFSLAAIATLAVAIGATATIYAVVHRVVLEPLPFPDANRLVWLDHAAPGIGSDRGLNLTQGLYQLYRRSSRTLQHIAVFSSVDMNVVAAGEPERLQVTRASVSFGPTLGVPPHLGRWMRSGEDIPGASPVAVLSNGFWSRRFGGDPGAVGRSVELDGVAYEIIGVMPASLDYPAPETAAWIPMALDASSPSFGSFSLSGIGRLAGGATPDLARNDLQQLLTTAPEAFPGATELLRTTRLTPLVTPLRDHVVGDVRRTLWLLLGAVSVVLLVAITNISGLFFVRAEARQREIVVRLALGARRPAIARFFFAESGLLAFTGAALGLGLGWAGTLALRTFGPDTLPRRAEIALDGPVLAVTIVVAALVALGLALPALRQQSPFALVLRASGRGMTSGRRSLHGRNLVVVIQVALAIMLMVGAGLMTRSFWNVRQVDPGFVADDVMTFEIGLSRSAYPSPERATALQRELLTRLASIPGVEAAGATTCLPLCQSWAGDEWRAQDRPLAPGESAPIAAVRRVSAGYVEALRIPLVAGRTLTAADAAAGAPDVVISAQLAKRLWPGQDPLGRRITNQRGDGAVWFTVVGIVANTPIRGVTEDPAPMVYLPFAATEASEPGPWRVAVIIRGSIPTSALMTAVRREVAAVDAALPVARPRSMQAILAAADARMAFTAIVLLGAATVALLLGALGIYGLLAYVVGRRIPEFGLRMALGATREDIVGMMLRGGFLLVGSGVALGLAGAYGMARVMRSMLFGITPADPLTFLLACAVLATTALVAIGLPARRAARVDALSALRNE
jgi:predicted permease